MPLYTYTARDQSGGRRTGIVDANSKALAVDLLKEQGLFVIDLKEKKKSIGDIFLNIRGVPEGDVVTFTRQLSTMISAGLPISRSLEVLADQTTNSKFKQIILDILRDVEGGTSFSQALGRYPDIFSPTYQALVRAGEASGKLDEILKRLATTMEAERDLKSRFKSAMIYPSIVFMAMIGVFAMLMVFVIPKLADMYESLNVDLPASTAFLISVSDFFVGHKFIVLIGCVSFVLGIRWFIQTDEGKNLISGLSFGLPIFGKLNKQKELTSFTRTLSLLISSAIPIVEALNIVGEVVNNKSYKRAASEAADNVEKGGQLSEYFKSNRDFPPLIGQMANVGEETGQMDVVLAKVAEYFDGETEHSIKGLSAALEPVILVMLGGMVGILIIAIITPIYKITSAL